MQEQIIGFEVAKLAKDKGFDWEVKTYFDFKKFGIKPVEFFNKIDANNFSYWNSDLNKKVNAGYISAPTQALLQKWLREKCNIRVFVVPIIFDNYSFRIYYPHPITKSLEKKYFEIEIGFKTYEEALEAGLFEALKLIKNEN